MNRHAVLNGKGLLCTLTQAAVADGDGRTPRQCNGWPLCASDSDKENSRLTQTAKTESSNPDHHSQNRQHPNQPAGANE